MSAAQKATLAPEPGSATGAVAVLGVLAGNEAYGIPLAAVREVLIPPPLTEVPRGADHFLGVIAVRGDIITVIDLPKMLKLETSHDDTHGRVLLVDNGQELIGVAVDSVIQVFRLEPEEIEYASTMSTDLANFVVGVGRVRTNPGDERDDMLILIDPMSLLGA